METTGTLSIELVAAVHIHIAAVLIHTKSSESNVNDIWRMLAISIQHHCPSRFHWSVIKNNVIESEFLGDEVVANMPATWRKRWLIPHWPQGVEGPEDQVRVNISSALSLVHELSTVLQEKAAPDHSMVH